MLFFWEAWLRFGRSCIRLIRHAVYLLPMYIFSHSWISISSVIYEHLSSYSEHHTWYTPLDGRDTGTVVRILVVSIKRCPRVRVYDQCTQTCRYTIFRKREYACNFCIIPSYAQLSRVHPIYFNLNSTSQA